FQAEVGIRDFHVTGVQTCALPIFNRVMPNSITVSNSFATSDITWGSNTQQRMIEGVIAYGRTSEQVFANPDKSNYANSDLTIIDEALFTVGDPRWRP